MTEKRKEWLEKAIFEYLKRVLAEGETPDSVDICSYFKLRADITLESLVWLEKDGYVERYNCFGFKYSYRIIKDIPAVPDSETIDYDRMYDDLCNRDKKNLLHKKHKPYAKV